MKSRVPHTLAALIAAAAIPLAHSQAMPEASAAPPAAPAADAPQAPANLVAEPVASVSRPDDAANAIAQALNAEASLKSTKITVQPDEGNILLTGTSLTVAQRMRASEIAASHAGAGTVINVIVPDEFVHWVPPTGPQGDVAETADTEAGSSPS